MLLLTSTSDLVRLVTGSAASTIEVHASYVDVSGTTITPGRTNTRITTATTTSIVGSPGAGTQRNVKGLYITNNSTGTNCDVAVQHTDGTNSVELMQFVLLPGENMTFNEEGGWRHRDRSGAEYPPAGLGTYNGRSIGFFKTSTGSDAVGYWYCTAKDAGFPGAWAPGTPGVNGRATDGTTVADAGCLPIANPATGANFLTEVQMATSVAHSNVFFDCLWVNSGLVVTTTTAQAIVSPTLPARDINGATAGEGCSIALYFSAASTMAAVSAAWTVSYTNSAGVAGRTATLTAIVGSQAPATPVVGTLVWFNLQAGDIGVQSIQSATFPTTLLTGTIHLMITRDIATIGSPIVNVNASRIMAEPGVRLYNGTCLLHCVMSSATTATLFSGEITVMEK
jgi:hypothetical protein